MIYEPNATRWEPGSLVLHDCDAKRPHMLMQVIGYTRDGLARCRYFDPKTAGDYPEIYDNDIKYLHDPKRFGVECPASWTDPNHPQGHKP